MGTLTCSYAAILFKFEGIWKETLESYGGLLKSAAEHLAVMIAIGFDLEPSHFKDAGRYGPHLLAPTATDLERFGKKDSIWAGFHTDLNALSIHGQSRSVSPVSTPVMQVGATLMV